MLDGMTEGSKGSAVLDKIIELLSGPVSLVYCFRYFDFLLEPGVTGSNFSSLRRAESSG